MAKAARELGRHHADLCHAKPDGRERDGAADGADGGDGDVGDHWAGELAAAVVVAHLV